MTGSAGSRRAFPEFAEHIGRPLTAVPDPCGRHPNWARALQGATARGAGPARRPGQRDQPDPDVHLRRVHRADCAGDAAPGRHRRGAGQVPHQACRRSDDDDPQTAVYYPFRPYCAVCGRDDTTVTAFDDETTEISYTCACGARVGPTPIAQVAGKLAWKVDWPMRWAYERVTFEPAGVDHSSPGSSFTVGGELVSNVRRRDAAALRVLLRRHHRVGEDERLARRRADPGRRTGDLRGPAGALAVRARSAPSRPSP